MRLLRTFPMLAYVVVLLSIVGVCVAGRSVGLLLVAGVLAALSWYVTEGPRGRSLPNWSANVLVVAVSLNVVVDIAQQPVDILTALGRFILWLTLIKLYQRKTPRDYAQLLALSLLLMLIGCLQTTDVLFAGTLLLYAALALYALLLFQLYAAHERNRAARLAAVPEGVRWFPSRQPISGPRTSAHLRNLMAGISIAGLGLSLFLFVIFPREMGKGFIGGVASSARVGFSSEIDLIGGTRITDSRKVVMNVRAEGDTFAHGDPLRLRGAALARYHGGGRWTRWHQTARRTIETTGAAPAPLAGADPAVYREKAEPGPLITQQVRLLTPMSTVFAAAVPVTLSTGEPRQFGFDPATHSIELIGPGRLDSYTVRSQPSPYDELLEALSSPASGPDSGDIAAQFSGGHVDVRVPRHARGVLASAGLPTEPPGDPDARWAWNAKAAEVLNDSFHDGTFAYTLDLRDIRLDTATEDPIVQFLFETRRGHCEYFASALAALCNSIGIPARLVAGYVALEYERGADTYIVRESNAHAWVEVQVGRLRWASHDPTPPATLRNLHAGRDSLADRWQWLFDRFEARWTSSFIAFDSNAQARLIRSLDAAWLERFGTAMSAIRRWAAGVNRAFRLGPAGYIWLGIVALAALIAAVALWSRLRRAARLRRTLRVRGTGALRAPLRRLGFYLDMLEVLRRAGVAKPAWQPPLRFAQALAVRRPAGAAIVRRLTETYYAARYGDRALSREQVAEAHRLVARLGDLL